ncbi:MAG TPA: hypothetical protein VL995_15140 [Cellvibrio sp.]|nr:hypothetical protein [Cellvibrio sp.]
MSLLNKFADRPARHSNTYGAGQREDIIRNVQNLLQTKRSVNTDNNIGLMDFCEQTLGDPLLHQLCNDIQQQIQLHEKRLCAINVSLVENSPVRWRLSISSQLVEPAGETFNFFLEFAKDAYAINANWSFV